MDVKINSINKDNLNTFIKKLLSIDNFIFITANKEKITSSVYFPERDAVKVVNCPVKEIFDGKFTDDVKISFFDGKKVINALSHFTGDVEGKISCDKYEDNLRATNFLVKDKRLKIDIPCTDFSLSFMEMSEDEIGRAFDTEDTMFNFELTVDMIAQIKSLFTLDSDVDTVAIYKNSKGIGVKGKNYENLLIEEDSEDEDGTVKIYKKYLDILDKENYDVFVCDNKIVFNSKDTDTHLCIATIEEDDDE
jgi:hypothetical protein